MSDSDYMSAPNWSDEQWGRVCKVVADEAQKSRIAAQFLPLYGPVAPDVVAVPNFRLGVVPGQAAPGARAFNRLDVDSTPDDFLTTISVQVPLPSYQVSDPELGAALVAFRRAAVTIARIEDAIIFNGQFARSRAPAPTYRGGWLAELPSVYSVSGGAAQPGLVPAGVFAAANVLAPAPVPAKVRPRATIPVEPAPLPATLKQLQDYGDRLVTGVSQATTTLEASGQSGPFACFLSPHAYDAAHTPATGLVLPRDRILPFLGGDYLRRTNTIPQGYGIIVALGGQPVEIVVARDITVRYQQQTAEPRFLFRVSEKIALRVKEWNAVAVLHPPVKDPEEHIKPRTVRPLAPSVKDVKEQIREAIEEVKGKLKDVKKDKAAQTAELIDRNEKLNAALRKEKDPGEQKRLVDEHQEFVAEHKRRGSELDRQDKEYEKEIKHLKLDIEGMNDLGD